MMEFDIFNGTMETKNDSQSQSFYNKDNETITDKIVNFSGGPNSTLILMDQQSNMVIEISQWLFKYYTPVIAITGTIGNILSVLVFFRTKLKKLSSSYYLTALGISDTGYLVIAFINWLIVLNINLYNRNYLCQLFTFLVGLWSALSVWFVVAFTVERFIAVLYPLKRQTMCTVRRAKSVLFFLVIYGFLHSLPILIFSGPQLNKQHNQVICDVLPKFQVEARYYNYYDTLLSFFLPLAMIVILNTFTSYTVWKLAGVRRTMTNHKRKKGTQSEDSARREHMHDSNQMRCGIESTEDALKVSSCAHLNGHHSIKQSCPKTNRQRISNSSQVKVTKMLLLVSTVFVLLNLPSYVLRLRAFLVDYNNTDIIEWQYVSQHLFVTNFGINFVLYCMSGQNFRKECIGLFRRKSTRRLEVGTQVTVSEHSMPSLGSNLSRKRTVTRNVSWNDTYEMQVKPNTNCF